MEVPGPATGGQHRPVELPGAFRPQQPHPDRASEQVRRSGHPTRAQLGRGQDPRVPVLGDDHAPPTAGQEDRLGLAAVVALAQRAAGQPGPQELGLEDVGRMLQGLGDAEEPYLVGMGQGWQGSCSRPELALDRERPGAVAGADGFREGRAGRRRRRS
jgi:hypothetical protein